MSRAHKGTIAEKLDELSIAADIDHEWDKTRPDCGSDAECEARVLLSLIQVEIRVLRVGLKRGKIDPSVGSILLAAYQQARDAAQADLDRALNTISVVRVNLGFTVPRWGGW